MRRLRVRIRGSFSLDDTLTSGQVFTWIRAGNRWRGVARGRAMRVWKEDGFLLAEGDDLTRDFLVQYFGLEEDLDHIHEAISRDRIAKRAVREHSGLRLLRQTPWEALLAFSVATHTNVKTIGLLLHRLSQSFGRPIQLRDTTLYELPTPEALSSRKEEEIRACGLGFRAPRILATAKAVADGRIDLENLSELKYRDALKKLLYGKGETKLLPGVGRKVADCILLYGYGFQEAVPVDVWIARLASRFYRPELPRYVSLKLATTLERRSSLSSGLYTQVAEFFRGIFQQYAGYAQLYLFHWFRLREASSRLRRSLGE